MFRIIKRRKICIPVRTSNSQAGRSITARAVSRDRLLGSPCGYIREVVQALKEKAKVNERDMSRSSFKKQLKCVSYIDKLDKQGGELNTVKLKTTNELTVMQGNVTCLMRSPVSRVNYN